MDASPKRPARSRATAVAASVLLAFLMAGCSGGVAQTEADDLAIFTDAGFLTGDEAAIGS